MMVGVDAYLFEVVVFTGDAQALLRVGERAREKYL